MFDFGEAKNKERYGQDTPPEIDMSYIIQTRIPIAMFVGKHDELGTTEDAQWTYKQINGKSKDWPIVKYSEIDGDAEVFVVGKDMNYFTGDVIELLEQYNPRMRTPVGPEIPDTNSTTASNTTIPTNTTINSNQTANASSPVNTSSDLNQTATIDDVMNKQGTLFLFWCWCELNLI